MNDHGDKQTAFEMCVVVPRSIVKKEDKKYDCIEVLIKELKNVGFIIDRAVGLTDEFIKVFFFFKSSCTGLLYFSQNPPYYSVQYCVFINLPYPYALHLIIFF